MNCEGCVSARANAVKWLLAIGLILTIGTGFAGKASAVVPGGEKAIDVGSFRSPGRDVRPHFIWYWPRNAVDDAELRLETQEMAQAGAGGFQILPEGGAALPTAGEPADAFDFGTPGWAEHIRTAMQSAQDNGMTADVTTSDSWPWISPVTSDNLDYSAQQLGFGAEDLTGPTEFVGAPPSAGFGPDAKLIAVTAARRDPAGTDSLGRSLLDPSSVRDLTSTLDGQGKVHWQVPAGDWVLFGFWQSSTHSAGFGCQQAPEQCANMGLIIDHLSRPATDAATQYLDSHLFSRLGDLPGRAGRLMHEDSLEGFQARLLWTGAFLREFRARRGYDLTPYLPALAVPAPRGLGGGGLANVAYDFGGGVGERIRHDYAQTLTELWVSNHIVPADQWAHTHGMRFSGRAIGFDQTALDPIAADRAYDVPEIDHITDSHMDWVSIASSGAHLSGSPTTNTELGDVINKDDMMTFPDLKWLADRQFSGGANELELHLFPYQHAVGSSWPSWSIFSSDLIPFGISEGWSPNMPQWKDFPEMTGYFARAQEILQAGRPVNDVAIYRDMQGSNWNGAFNDSLDPLEPLINSSLTNSGFTFDIANPAAVTDPGTSVRNGQLVMEHPRYRALVIDLDGSARRGVVDSSDAMSAAVARRLVSFGEAGLPIVFVGRYPDRGVSYADPAAEDKAVNDAVASLRRMPNVRLASDPMDVAATLEQLGVQPDLSLTGVSAEPVQCGHGAPCVYNVHRHTPSGDYWFLWNAGSTTVHFTGSFDAGSRAPSSWNLWNGVRSPIGLYDARGGRVRVPIQLAPGESTVIGFDDPITTHVVATDAQAVVARGSELYLRSTQAGNATATLSDGGQREVQFKNLPSVLEPSQWHLHVDGAVPSGTDTHDLDLTQLEDWRDIPEIASSSGTGTYTTNLTLGSAWTGPGRGAFLELGDVEGGSVLVFVNGHRVSNAVVPPPRLDIGPFLRPGSNQIEVVLQTTLKNRLYSLSSQPGYLRFADRPDKTMAYGLLGPVKLVPYEDQRIP